jgi:CHASE3 domain sensor protein
LDGGITAGLGLIGWVLKSAVDEMQRLNILLNKTREEMARDYVTKADSSTVMGQIVARFDRIEEKIDRLMER